MKANVKRTIIYSAVIGGILAASLVTFFISRSIRSDYKTYSVKADPYNTKINEQKKIIEASENTIRTETAKGEDADQAVIEAEQQKITTAQGVIESIKADEKYKTYTARLNKDSAIYQPLAITSYVCSIGGLAAFGVCLAVSDRIKRKEEEAAGRS